ncbi:MAG TPA: CotH kinase family protein [Bacteroidales bacterium]|nr:CotH kinase family protein [Bacteroidales bacterium]
MAKVKSIILFLILSVLCAFTVRSQSDFYDADSIREVRIYFKEGNWDYILDSLHQYVGEDGRLLGDVMVEGKMFRNIGVRYKGYSSFDPDVVKSPFNIDLEYNYNNQNYQGYTKLKLSNVIQDPSFVREVLSYEIARKYLPASKANFANVYVNDTLLGLYTNVEAVDKNFAGSRFGERDNTFFKGAPEHLIIPGGQNSNLTYFDDDTSSYKPYYKLESDDPEKAWPDLLRLIDILNNDTSHIDTILYIDRTLWMHAINYALVNLDSYIGYSQNYYLYMDNYGRFNPVMWDFNMSFGSFKETDGITAPPNGLTILKRKSLDPLKMLASTPLSPRPLIVNLLQNPTRKKMFLAHMKTIINENFRNNFYLTRGLELQNRIDQYVQNDTNKFYPYAQFHQNLDTTVGSGNNVFPGLRDLMEARIAYLDTFPGFQGAPVISEISHDPDFPAQGAQVWINAAVSGAGEVFLHYRYKTDAVFKSICMYDDGAHNDSVSGDGIFGAGIMTKGPVVQYYIYAQNDSAGMFSPERAAYEFYHIQPLFNSGDMVINELMSGYGMGNSQGCGLGGWIEIFNTTGESQDIGQLFLSDDPEEPLKWAFPDTVVAGQSFIVVWADADTSQGKLHAGFSTNHEGGRLYLLDANTNVLDSVRYGLQSADRTYGRYPNGYGPFIFMQPSFAENNYIETLPAGSFVLFPNPATGNIYCELSNSGDIVSYKIYNSKGQHVISGYPCHKSSMGSEIVKIDISGLHIGLYLMVIETSNGLICNKFVIGQ